VVPQLRCGDGITKGAGMPAPFVMWGGRSAIGAVTDNVSTALARLLVGLPAAARP
jgi:hypothetical protein